MQQTMTIPPPFHKTNRVPQKLPPAAITSTSCSQSMTDVDTSVALHSPSTAVSNAMSVSYGSISIPSNFHQSQTSTPTGGPAPAKWTAQPANPDAAADPPSNKMDLTHLIDTTKTVTCTKSNPVTPNSHSQSNSFSVTKTKGKKTAKKRKRSAAEKFGDEFWNKAKVAEIVRGNGIIGHFEATAMLANFRNVTVDQIDSTDLAFRYLESMTVRRLKRHLKDMDYTIRKLFYYGCDFQWQHEQYMLGQHDEMAMPDVAMDSTALNTQQNVLNLGDLSNHLSVSLDEYLQSPHTVLTPSKESKMADFNLFTADTADMESFDPLKGAQNVVMKPKVRFMHMKSPPVKAMAAHEEDEQKMSPRPWKKRGSTTKQFGKYFDKRGSNVSHGSIWSESSDGDAEEDMHSHAGSEDSFVLAQYNGRANQDGDAPKLIDFPSHDDEEREDDGLAALPSRQDSYSLEVPPHATTNAKLFGHMSHLSFASSVSLCSDYGVSRTSFGAISENAEVNEMEGGQGRTSLQRDVSGSSTSSRKSKKLKRRKYTNEGQEISPPAAKTQQHGSKGGSDKPIKLLKIDSLLLEPDNQTQPKHDAQFSLDSLLSDMELPEPTPVQKLKYHLTEPRLPPTRRRTYG